jgi:hypothetical protein
MVVDGYAERTVDVEEEPAVGVDEEPAVVVDAEPTADDIEVLKGWMKTPTAASMAIPVGDRSIHLS